MFTYRKHIGDTHAFTKHLNATGYGILHFLLDDAYTREDDGIPNDPSYIYAVTRVKTKSEKQLANKILEEFFYLDDERNAWFNSRANQEIEAYRANKPEDNEEKARNSSAERTRRCREERKKLFEQAKALGINVAWNERIGRIRELLSEAHATQNNGVTTVTNPATCSATGRYGNVTGNATVTANNNHKPETNNRETNNNTVSPLHGNSGNGNAACNGNGVVVDVPPVTSFIAGQVAVAEEMAKTICRALKDVGIPDAKESNKDFLALLAEGLCETDFLAHAQYAKERAVNSPFGYLLMTIKKKVEQGKALNPQATPRTIFNPQVAREEANRVIARQWMQEGSSTPRNDVIDVKAKAVAS